MLRKSPRDKGRMARKIKNMMTPKLFSFSLPVLSQKLMDKKVEMENAEKDLEEMKLRYEDWKKEYELKEKVMNEKNSELALRNDGLKEFKAHHLHEIEKAILKEKNERTKSLDLEHDLQQLREEEAQLCKENIDLRNELEALQPYADYLQNVIDISPNFETIDSILNKYQSMVDTRKEYIEKYKDLLAQVELKRNKVAELQENKKVLLIDSTMNYHQSVSKVQDARRELAYRKSHIVKEIQRMEEKETEIASIRSSIRTIFKRAYKASMFIDESIKGKSDKLTDEEMVEFIVGRHKDLVEIIKAYKESQLEAKTQ